MQGGPGNKFFIVQHNGDIFPNSVHIIDHSLILSILPCGFAVFILGFGAELRTDNIYRIHGYGNKTEYRETKEHIVFCHEYLSDLVYVCHSGGWAHLGYSYIYLG